MKSITTQPCHARMHLVLIWSAHLEILPRGSQHTATSLQVSLQMAVFTLCVMCLLKGGGWQIYPMREEVSHFHVMLRFPFS